MRRTNIIVLALLHLFITRCYAQQKYDNTLLWEISGNNLKQPSYLFGTFHINHEEVFNVNDSVLAKLVRVDAFANEVNVDSLSQYIGKIVKDSSSKTMYELFDEEELSKIRKFLKKKKSHYADNFLDKSPYQVYMEISGFSTKKGEQTMVLDGWLYNIARSYGKKIFGLEDMDSSIALARGTPDEEQREMILNLLDGNDKRDAYEKKMLDCYIKEDINAIDKMVNGSSKYVKDVLLIERNHKMKDAMKESMAQQSCFFAVGTAHLPGDEGLINLLKKDGYTVTPVTAPHTGHYKKFLKDAAGIKWEEFRDESRGYSVEMPGKPGLIEKGKMDMNGYYDYGTGRFYLATAVGVPREMEQEESENMLKFLQQKFGRKGKVSKKKTIEHSGAKGIEMTLTTDEFKMRMRVLSKNAFVYVFMEGAPVTESKLEFADRFFNSVNLFAPAEAEYLNFVSDSGAFSMSVPSDFKLETSDKSGHITKNIFSGTDKKRRINYGVIYLDGGYGRFYRSWQDALDKLKENFADEESAGMKINEIKWQDYPAVEMLTISETSCSKIVYVLKENRLYALMAESGKQNFDTACKVLGSFTFNTYKKCELKKFDSPEKDFSVLMPLQMHSGKIEDENKNDADTDTLTKNYYGTDPFSSLGFNIISEQFDKHYYYSKGETEYFNEVFKALFAADSTLNFKLNWEGNVISASAKTILSGNNHLSYHARVLLNGKYCYTLSCFVPSNDYGDSLAAVFLNSFKMTDHKPVPIFTSHLAELLEEFRTADTSKTEGLLNTLIRYETSRSDTLHLMKALEFKYADDTSSSRNVRYHIYDKLFDAQDSTAISSHYVIENYEKMGANPAVKILALSKLAADTTENNYKMLKQWLLRDKPEAENNFSIYRLFGDLRSKNNRYAKLLYPELLDLGSEPGYRFLIYYTTCELIKDTLLDVSIIAPVKDRLIREAVAALDSVTNDPKFDSNGYFGDLNSLVCLANNFIDSRVMELNWKIINKSVYSEYADALTYLSKRNVKLDMKLVSNSLAKPDYRYEIYKALKESGQFPSKYLKQQYFAETDLYNYLVGDEDYSPPEKIEYAGSLEVQYHKEKKRIYVYRVVYKDYETQKPVMYLAWAGPFALDENVIDVSGGELTGSNWDKWDPDTYKQTVLKMVEEADKKEEIEQE